MSDKTQEPGEQPGAVVVPVFLYHSVSTVPAAGQERFTVTPARFAEHVAAIAASGRVALTISEYARALRGERPLPTRAVAVTFDDGFPDTLEAVEMLRGRGITSTVYITSNRLDRPQGASTEAAREIAATGAELGAHSVSHPHLDELPLAMAVHEIEEGKRSLEQRLEMSLATFAYPHGAHDRRVRQAVIDAGFSSAAAVKNALSHDHDDPFAIARLTITADTPSSTVLAALDGRGAPIAWAGERYQTRAFREYRRLRRRARVVGRRSPPPDGSEVIGAEEPADGVLRAPAAVRMVDLALAEDLPLPRTGTPYASAYLVGTRAGRPVAARTLDVDGAGIVSAGEISRLFADVASEPPAGVAPTGALPAVSVVVTTCGKDELVTQAVASVLDCDPGPLEVIVVENRPHGSTVAATMQREFGVDARVRCVMEPRVGLSHARNAGLAVATGEVVAFTDDDVLVDRNWVGGLARGFATERDVACVTGLILPADLETPSQVQVEQFAGFGKGWQRRVFHISEPTSVLFPFAAGEFGSGACTALRREVANELGGFANELGAGTVARGGEDLDLYVRVLLAGHALVYEPAAILWHRHPDHPQHLRSEVFSYGVGLSAMMTKQLMDGHTRAILQRVPAGLRFLRDPESRKNVRKVTGYPKEFDWIERAGFAAGPFAYLASRRQERRLKATAARDAPAGR